MTKHAKLCKAVESAYSGILLKEEQAAIVNAVLAELREPGDDMWIAGDGVFDACERSPTLEVWQAMIDAIGYE